MRKFFRTIVMLAGLSAPMAASAQLQMPDEAEAKFHGLTASQFIQLMQHTVNAAPLIGKPAVYIINATPDMIAAIKCGKYVMIGSKPDIDGNPTQLPPWSVTYMSTVSYEGYCEKGLVAQTNSQSLAAHPNAGDGNFKDSTFIVITLK